MINQLLDPIDLKSKLPPYDQLKPHQKYVIDFVNQARELRSIEPINFENTTREMILDEIKRDYDSIQQLVLLYEYQKIFHEYSLEVLRVRTQSKKEGNNEEDTDEDIEGLSDLINIKKKHDIVRMILYFLGALVAMIFFVFLYGIITHTLDPNIVITHFFSMFSSVFENLLVSPD